jgi:capsular polysaccharide biosynthesis protein
MDVAMETSQQTDIEVSRLFPEQVLRRNLPVNLKPEDRRLFENEFEQRIPATELLVMHDVFASSEGLLFKSRRILPQSFAAPFLLDAWKSKSRIKFLANNYLFKSSRRLEGNAVWIVDEWSGGYYHWVVDTLPRLFAIRERLRDLTLLLPHRLQALEFVGASLRPFELQDVQFVGAHERVFCPRLIVPMHTAPTGSHNEEMVRGIRALMVESYGDPQYETPLRIYISRRKAAKRRIINEDEVLEVVSEFQFRIINAEELTFAQQVHALSSAGYVVSNHGAGLTNMMFMPPRASILELRHETDRSYNCYFNLASALDMKYFYQACAPANPGEDAHSADIQVDVGTLRETLKLMTRQESS